MQDKGLQKLYDGPDVKIRSFRSIMACVVFAESRGVRFRCFEVLFQFLSIGSKPSVLQDATSGPSGARVGYGIHRTSSAPS